MIVKEKQMEEQSGETSVAVEEFSSELNEPRWAVVSFEKTVAGNLTYAEAEQKRQQLENEKVAGLCIITDEAAARISKSTAR
ncbi:MAG TPA: hypothetical protein VGC76_14835 [Pyrinomonadaceae bacterium]|jgi:hypothetical protein